MGQGNLTVSNSTISGNSSNVEGGAGIFISAGGLHRVMYTTITDNTIVNPSLDTTRATVFGGGIRVYGSTLELGKSIISGNHDGRFSSHANYSPDIGQDDTSSIASYDDNLIGIVGNRLGDYYGADGFAYDWFGNGVVGLGPLADNGGETLTHELLSGDPIDAYSGDGGDAAFAAPADDQTHYPRTDDGNGDGVGESDSGSFEF